MRREGLLLFRDEEKVYPQKLQRLKRRNYENHRAGIHLAVVVFTAAFSLPRIHGFD